MEMKPYGRKARNQGRTIAAQYNHPQGPPYYAAPAMDYTGAAATGAGAATAATIYTTAPYPPLNPASYSYGPPPPPQHPYFAPYTPHPQHQQQVPQQQHPPPPPPPTHHPSGQELTVEEKVRSQIEYYMSENNLFKDIFLRSKMDKDGFVLLSEIVGFRRVAMVTQDMDIVLSAIKDSQTIEICDGVKIRPRKDPLRWPLPAPAPAPQLVLQQYAAAAAALQHHQQHPPHPMHHHQHHLPPHQQPPQHHQSQALFLQHQQQQQIEPSATLLRTQPHQLKPQQHQSQQISSASSPPPPPQKQQQNPIQSTPQTLQQPQQLQPSQPKQHPTSSPSSSSSLSIKAATPLQQKPDYLQQQLGQTQSEASALDTGNTSDISTGNVNVDYNNSSSGRSSLTYATAVTNKPTTASLVAGSVGIVSAGSNISTNAIANNSNTIEAPTTTTSKSNHHRQNHHKSSSSSSSSSTNSGSINNNNNTNATNSSLNNNNNSINNNTSSSNNNNTSASINNTNIVNSTRHSKSAPVESEWKEVKSRRRRPGKV